MAVQNLNDEGITNKSSSANKLVNTSAPLKAGERSPGTMNSPTYELKNSVSPDFANSSTQGIYEQPPKAALVGDVMLDAALYYQKFTRTIKIVLT